MQEQPPNSRMTSDVLLTFAARISLLLLNVGATVAIARALGADGRGSVAVAFSLTLLLINMGGLGIRTANPFFATRRPEQIGRIVANTLWIAGSAGIVLMAGAVLVKAAFPDLLRGLGYLDLTVALVGVPTGLAVVFLQSVLLAEGRMRAYNGIEVGVAAAVLVILTAGYLLGIFGVTETIAIFVAGSIVSTGVYLRALWRHSPPVLSAPDWDLAREMMRYGLRAYAAALLAYITARIGLLAVNSYLGEASAGQYSVALALAEGMFAFPVVVGLNLLPRVARGGTLEQTARVFRYVGLTFGIVCLVAVPLAGPGIDLIFGAEFDDAPEIFLWMLPGIFAYGMVSILAVDFAGRGFPISAVLAWIPGFIANFAILFVYLPDGDPWVAALAASIANCTTLLIHMWKFADGKPARLRALLPNVREAVEISRGLLSGMRAR